MAKTHREPDERQSIRKRITNFSEGTTATITAAIITGLTTLIGVILGVIIPTSPSSTKPAPSHPFNYLPYLLGLIGVIALVVLAVGFLAARAGIRRRERRLDLIERLLIPDTLTASDSFTNDARSSYVATLGQFARDVVELSKTVSRREASDVVTARQVRRAAELLSVGSASRRGNYMGSIGGVLLGAGLAELFALLATAKPSPLEIGLTFTASMAGAVLLAYQWFSG